MNLMCQARSMAFCSENLVTLDTITIFYRVIFLEKGTFPTNEILNMNVMDAIKGFLGVIRHFFLKGVRKDTYSRSNMSFEAIK